MHVQVGFGDNQTSPFADSPNQRVASSSASADIGQPLAVARVATAGAVIPCEVLVQMSASPYPCGLGYCNSLQYYVKNW